MNNNYHPTPTVPWINRLAQILRSSSSSSTTPNRLLSSRHPTGEIWKHIFSICVYHDLETLVTTPTWKETGRFVRLEQSGLSGVILYEIPFKRDINGRANPRFTLEEVFGRKEAKHEDGMSMTQLLDSTQAKLIYFPAYACTSFIVGQVMQASISNIPQIAPYPARDGFFVYRVNPDDNPTRHNEHSTSTTTAKFQAPTTFGKDVELDVLSSTDSDSEQMEDKGDSSIDSFGPHTPPRFDSPPIQEYVKEMSLPAAEAPCLQDTDVFLRDIEVASEYILTWKEDCPVLKR